MKKRMETSVRENCIYQSKSIPFIRWQGKIALSKAPFLRLSPLVADRFSQAFMPLLVSVFYWRFGFNSNLIISTCDNEKII